MGGVLFLTDTYPHLYSALILIRLKYLHLL